ncbi:MAG: cyclase family protein [Gemmatimonadota bacterium]|nr:cyclase family protein [Gemmatimonadota bacterium]
MTRGAAAALLAVAGLAAAVAVATRPTGRARGGAPAHVLDLGHPLSATDPTWSGRPTFERTGSPSMGRIATDEHFGTHLDAPVHSGGTWAVDQIPVDHLVRPGVTIAVTGMPEDYEITLADVKAWEAQHGAVPEGAIVLFATGWDARWSDAKAYMNERDGVKHFPGIAQDAASYLRERKVVGVGIDSPSVDHGPSETFATHRITNSAGIFHIENAAHLTELPARGFTVVVAPVNTVGGSGGPTRVFALLP